MELDPTDWKILSRLQDEARISNVDLAKAVNLSPSPCLTRVRALEQSRVISRYVTLLDPLKIGLTVSVFIQVSLEKQMRNALDTFEASVLARDEEAIDLASRYQMLGFHDVIFTRLDESSRQGLMLNFQERFRVPLHSFSYGSRIPEDYEFATKERVIDFLFKLSKVTRREESL